MRSTFYRFLARVQRLPVRPGDGRLYETWVGGRRRANSLPTPVCCGASSRIGQRSRLAVLEKAPCGRVTATRSAMFSSTAVTALPRATRRRSRISGRPLGRVQHGVEPQFRGRQTGGRDAHVTPRRPTRSTSRRTGRSASRTPRSTPRPPAARRSWHPSPGHSSSRAARRAWVS